jgi:hypothetical protein
MPGRNRVPSFQLASGTTDERDGSYNISNTLGSIFYNTDTSNVEIRHEDPSNNVGWRDLVMNNKEQIDISGNVVVIGDVGIGTTNPSQKLDVDGNINVGKSLSNPRIGRFLSGSVHNADKRDSVYFGRWDGNGDDGFLGMKLTTDTHTNLGYGSYSNQTLIGFYAWGNSYAVSRVVMTIDAGGNVKALGQFTVSSSLSTSDDRIKENEKLIVNATETLSKLTPQIYDKYETMDLSGSFFVESGLIAQEVYYNAPELRHLVHVSNDIDASGNISIPTPEEMDLSGVEIGSDPDYGSHGWSKTKPSSLNYQGLIPYLIKSNQEQQTTIEQLEARLAALENK